MKKNRLVINFLALIVPMISIADDKEIATIYKKHGIEGTIIIASLDGKVEYVHNRERAEQRFLPASTFKIPNTLIALETKSILDDNEVIKWDGSDKGWERWNKDQTLKTAFSISCVWCYQKFAKQIGNEQYIKYLNELEYGNQKTGDYVTTFWLEGDLAISAREQIQFLRKLYNEQLPFKKRNILLLKKIMVVDETQKYILSAKTGWANRIENPHGWFVGYVVVNENMWLFANNIRVKIRSDLKFRKTLVIESLKIKGII
jgi:beta-lactamase class D